MRLRHVVVAVWPASDGAQRDATHLRATRGIRAPRQRAVFLCRAAMGSALGTWSDQAILAPSSFPEPQASHAGRRFQNFACFLRGLWPTPRPLRTGCVRRQPGDEVDQSQRHAARIASGSLASASSTPDQATMPPVGTADSEVTLVAHASFGLACMAPPRPPVALRRPRRSASATRAPPRARLDVAQQVRLPDCDRDEQRAAQPLPDAVDRTDRLRHRRGFPRRAASERVFGIRGVVKPPRAQVATNGGGSRRRSARAASTLLRANWRSTTSVASAASRYIQVVVTRSDNHSPMTAFMRRPARAGADAPARSNAHHQLRHSPVGRRRGAVPAGRRCAACR